MSRGLLIAAACAGCGRVGFGGEIDARTSRGSDAGSAMGSDGAAPPSCAGFDICDQFEDATLAPIWQPVGAVAHTTTLAHRGTGALHLNVPAVAAGGQGGALIRETTIPGTGSPPFWVRIWVRVNGHAAPQNHLELISADQFTGGGLGDYLFAEADATALYSQFDNGIASLPAPIPLDTWTCLIWHVAPNDGTMHLDGDLGSSSYSGVANGNPPVSLIEIGPFFDPTNVAVDQAGFDVWLDDVIIHHAAVTCAD